MVLAAFRAACSDRGSTKCSPALLYGRARFFASADRGKSDGSRASPSRAEGRPKSSYRFISARLIVSCDISSSTHT